MFFPVWLRTVSNPLDINRFLSHTGKIAVPECGLDAASQEKIKGRFLRLSFLCLNLYEKYGKFPLNSHNIRRCAFLFLYSSAFWSEGSIS